MAEEQINNEVSDQDQNDFSAGFGSYKAPKEDGAAGIPTPPKEKKTAENNGGTEETAGDSNKPPVEKPEGDDTEKKADPPKKEEPKSDALKRAEERAEAKAGKTAEAGDKSTKQVPLSSSEEQGGGEDQGASNLTISDDDIKNIMDIPVDMPAKFSFDGKEYDFEQMFADFPEMKMYGKVMAAAMAEGTIQHYVREGVLMTKNSVEGLLGELGKRLDGIEHDMKLGIKHSDFSSVLESKEYGEWLGQQKATLQKLAKSEDPGDVEFVLDAFKDHVKAEQEKATKPVDKEAAGRKKRVDDLHSNSLRSKPDLSTKENEDKDDFSAGFKSYKS